MQAQNLTTTRRVTSQDQNQHLTTQVEVSPYGDSDSFVDSFSDEVNEESVDAPTRQRTRKQTHMKSSRKATTDSHKRRVRELVRRSGGPHAEESGTVTCEPAHNMAHPNKELNKKAKRSTGDSQKWPTEPIVVYQNWPVGHNVAEVISNPNTSIGLTQHSNADSDVDEELRKSLEHLSRSIEDLEKEIA